MSIEYIIKKSLSIFLEPLNIAVFLIIISLILLRFQKYKKAKTLLFISIIWTILISSTQFAKILILPLESQYKPLNKIPKNVNNVLILGGDRYKRGWEALRLYNMNKNLNFITSGESFKNDSPDATKMANLLIQSGISKDKITQLIYTKTTKDEAKYIKKLLNNKPFILVTSAYHMPRAMLLFKKYNLNPIAAPTEFYNPKEYNPIAILSSVQLQKVEQAIHEYFGILYIYLGNLFK